MHNRLYNHTPECTPDRSAFDEALDAVAEYLNTAEYEAVPSDALIRACRGVNTARAYADSRDRLVDAWAALSEHHHFCASCDAEVDGCRPCGTPECQDAIMRWREGERRG